MRGFNNKKFKELIEYPSVPSVTKPKPHGPEYPVPVPIRTAVITGKLENHIILLQNNIFHTKDRRGSILRRVRTFAERV